jgi:hypothetical protein
VNLRLNNQKSLLTVACRHMRMEVVKFLVSQPAFDGEESLALHAIPEALDRFPEVLPVLAAAPGVDINAVLPRECVLKWRKGSEDPDPAPVENLNALGFALRRSSSRSVAILAQIPSLDPAHPDGNGRNILFHAPVFVYFDFTRLIAGRGVDVNAQDQDGNTALHAAVIDGRPEALVQLVLLGIDRSIRNAKGETAWALAQKSAGLPVKELGDEPESVRDYTVKMVGLVMRKHSIAPY